MIKVFEQSTVNFDMISIFESECGAYYVYFNAQFISQNLTYIQALHEVERQISL